jgi:hypothetical protein
MNDKMEMYHNIYQYKYNDLQWLLLMLRSPEGGTFEILLRRRLDIWQRFVENQPWASNYLRHKYTPINAILTQEGNLLHTPPSWTSKTSEFCIFFLRINSGRSKNCALLGRYATSSDNATPAFRGTYRARLEGSRIQDGTGRLSRNAGMALSLLVA